MNYNMVGCSDNYNEISLADGFFAIAGIPTILSYAQEKVYFLLQFEFDSL